jgi:2-polyprenyl-3-methyl-5-hydroxy-6-metoxy-1,4-benzoquinol methylase
LTGSADHGSAPGDYANVAGNHYDKYNTRNPIARALMHGFLSAFDELTASTGARSAYEAGCGEGNLSMRLVDRGWAVQGCDLEASSVAQANAQCVERGLPPAFEARSLYDLTADQRAPLAICCEVLEHVPETQMALAALRRIAAPYLLLSVPREPLWRALNLMRGRYISDLGNTPGHIQHWSAADFIALVAAHFEIVAVRHPLPWTMVLCRVD